MVSGVLLGILRELQNCVLLTTRLIVVNMPTIEVDFSEETSSVVMAR